MNDKTAENNLEKVMVKYGIHLQTYEKNNAKYFYISEKNAEEIPFEDLSDKYRSSRQKRSRFSNIIDLQEMIYVMKNKKQLLATTKSNMHKLVEFYEAVGRIKIKNNFEIIENSKTDLFRYQDKITYRFIKTMTKIFPDIDSMIKTQQREYTIRGDLIFDIYIPISEENVIGIEIDEKHHSNKNTEIVDKHKRNFLSRVMEIRTFVKGRDDTKQGFDQFIRSICYDIINYHDVKHLQRDKLKYISNFISYNIKTVDDENVSPLIIEKFITIINTQYIEIDQLVEILYSGDEDSYQSITKSLKDMIKKSLINKKKIKYDENKKDILGLHKTEFMKFLMMHQDVSCNRYRVMFSRINSEYISILSGEYHKYRYKCSKDAFDDACDNELFVFGNLQIKSNSEKKKHLSLNILKGNVSKEDYEQIYISDDDDGQDESLKKKISKKKKEESSPDNSDLSEEEEDEI